MNIYTYITTRNKLLDIIFSLTTGTDLYKDIHSELLKLETSAVDDTARKAIILRLTSTLLVGLSTSVWTF